MRRGEGACLVCGAELTYYQEAKEMTCVFCGKKEMSHASCKEGHYVCDSCHAEKGIEAIMRECGVTASKNPIEIMQKIMEDPYIYMHGPEHHVNTRSRVFWPLIITAAASWIFRQRCRK